MDALLSAVTNESVPAKETSPRAQQEVERALTVQQMPAATSVAIVDHGAEAIRRKRKILS